MEGCFFMIIRREERLSGTEWIPVGRKGRKGKKIEAVWCLMYTKEFVGVGLL